MKTIDMRTKTVDLEQQETITKDSVTIKVNAVLWFRVREKRARIVKAEAELEASLKLTQGAKEMEGSPIALELRRLQMLSEIGIDNNTSTIVLLPSEFTAAARGFSEVVKARNVDNVS